MHSQFEISCLFGYKLIVSMEVCMKKRFKLALFILGLLLFLVGCERPINQGEVEKGFKEKYPNTSYEILSKVEFDKDDVKHQDPSMILDARSKEYGFEFKMYSIKNSNNVFWPDYTSQSDYSMRLLEYLVEMSDLEKDMLEINNHLKHDIGPAYLEFEYRNMSELDKGFKQVNNFVINLPKEASNMNLAIGSYHKDILGLNDSENSESNVSYKYVELTPREKGEKPYTVEERREILDEFYDSSVLYYSRMSASHRINEGDYPIDKLIEQTEEKLSYQFSVIIDNNIFYWKDIYLYNNYDLPIMGMYSVLERLDYSSLEGNENSFSFIGANGSLYEFSTEFIDRKKVVNGSRGEVIVKSNYYKLDGEIKFFQWPNSWSLTKYQWGNMVGHRFIDGWHDVIPALKLNYN